MVIFTAFLTKLNFEITTIYNDTPRFQGIKSF